jgi:putative spermidine/putrescine transport system substrate-binding protein
VNKRGSEGKPGWSNSLESGPLFDVPVSRRRFIEAGLMAGAGVLLAACGGNAKPTSGGSLKVPSTKPDKLVVRSWADPFSTAIGDYPGKAFTDETGIAVQFDFTDVGEIHTKVQQSVEAGRRPPVDVVYTVGSLAVLGDVQELAVPLDLSVVSNYSSLTAAGKALADPPAYVHIYSHSFPFIFATERIQLQPGISWNDLYDPKYRGKIHADYLYSGAIYPIAKIVGVDVQTGDMTPVWDKLSQLRPNIGSVGDDTVFIEAMKSGEVDFGYTLVANALALKDAGVDVDWVAAAEGVSVTVDSMYVPKLLPDDVTYWAQVFINTVLDAKQQSDFTAALATVPTNKDAVPADFMKSDPSVFPFSDDDISKYALVEPLEVAARNNDDWQAKYNQAVGA